MAALIRCELGIDPSQKLPDGARGLDLDIGAAGASEPCLFLIPDDETEAEAEGVLEEVDEAIFVAELAFWHRNNGPWPAERTYPVVRNWFEVRVYPLIQDLVGEELTTTQPNEQFLGELRTSLEELSPLPCPKSH